MSGFISYPFLKGGFAITTPAELAFIKWQEPPQHLRLDLRSSISLRSMLPYALPVPVTGPVGGGALITGETDAMGIDFTYFGDITKQMAVTTSSVEVDSAPFTNLTYTSPSLKLCRQSDGVWRYANHNLALDSQTMTSANYTSGDATITANDTNAPDGTATAEKFTNGTDVAKAHQNYQQILSYINGASYVVSVFAKQGTGRYFSFSVANAGGDYVHACFDLQLGTVTQTAQNTMAAPTASIVSAANGFYRCQLIFTVASSPSYTIMNSSDTGTFTPDGFGRRVFNGAGETYWFWGLQAKRYPVNDALGYTYATGYIATTSAAKYDLPYEWDASLASQGILIEEQRINITIRSQDLNNWLTFNGAQTITSDATTAPDGTTTADRMIPTTGSSDHYVTQGSLTVSAAAYTVSAFFKPIGSYNKVELLLTKDSGFSKYYGRFFDVSTGTVGSSESATYTGTATITDAGNGWYRCTLTVTLDANSTHAILIKTGAADPIANPFTGDGTSGAYVWGIQLEQGAFATSPIHTIGATVTRAVDTISLATSAFPVNAARGTLYAKFNPINVAAIRYALAQDDDTANEHFSIGSSAAGAGQFYVVDGGTDQTLPLTNGTVTAGAANKIAASWQVNDFAVSTNGTAASTDTTGTLPTVTKLKFGVGNVSTRVLNGYLQHVVSLPRDMTDGELQTRTM